MEGEHLRPAGATQVLGQLLGEVHRAVAAAGAAEGHGDVAARVLLEARQPVIEEIIEPYLVQQGFLQRTPRGRVLTAHAFKHLGLAEPRRDPSQMPLFDQGDDA